MWLLYFRFDDQGEVVTMHVRTKRKSEAVEIIAMAKERGFTPTAKLVEYALFSSNLTIYPITIPNFHYMLEDEFRRRWQEQALVS